MGLNRLTNPVSIQVLGELNYDQFESDVSKLKLRISRDDDSRASWLKDVKEIIEQLNGKDEREHKPWKHASDLSMPLTKKLLRRWIPVLYNLVAGADPVTYFYAGDAKAAVQSPSAEAFFDWLFKVYMDDSLKEIRYLIYNIGAKGVGFLGVHWDYRTEVTTQVIQVEDIWPKGPPPDINSIVGTLIEQYFVKPLRPETQQSLMEAAQRILEGQKFVKLTYTRVVADKPRIRCYRPEDVVVPIDSEATHDADYVCLIHKLLPDRLRQMAQDGILNPEAVEAAIGGTPAEDTRQADSYDREHDHDAGLQTELGAEDGPMTVYQVYCRLDINGDGIGERCVLWYAKDKGEVLALHPYPYPFDYWPVFRFDFEDTERGPFRSRGIGHLLKDLQDQYNKQYRATSDAIDIQLAPVFIRRAASPLMPRTFKWGPGAILDVSSVGELQMLEKTPLNLHQYLQDRAELKSFSEELVGSIDAALAATGRRLERRTAFEVDKVSGIIEQITSMDSATFQSVMGRVFQCIWDLWIAFGPNEIYFNVLGEPEPKLFRKGEYQYKFTLVPAGTPGNTNRRYMLAMAMQILEIFMKAGPDLINRHFLLFYIANLLDRRLAKNAFLPQHQQALNSFLQQLAQQVATGNAPEVLQQLTATELPLPENLGGTAGGEA